MPRCFMAKKWKQVAYEKEKLRAREAQNNTDKVSNPGDSLKEPNHWRPASPTEGATAPSPPPSWLPTPTAGKVTVLFNGK